jgi:hypothetical protein
MRILLAGTIEFVQIEQVSALDKFYCIMVLPLIFTAIFWLSVILIQATYHVIAVFFIECNINDNVIAVFVVNCNISN